MAEDSPAKEQRIRDPVHGLIVFAKDDPFEQLIWRLLNAREFQRLRRIKQLGFSELVYPGATHTRFSHSVGVFHTARMLVRVIREKLGTERFDQSRANIAICAALLHDLGHGPFSHTFEGALKKLGNKKKHEDWTVEIICGDSEIHAELDAAKDFPDLGARVAELLGLEEQPPDIYASIVSSQFDADRLDYLRRDKLMTGTEQGGFDWAWLMNNLEIGKITIGGDVEQDPFEVDGLILGQKARAAAEGYLLGRFHLYTEVYFHKTTRAAEKMLGALLHALVEALRRDPASCGLTANHPISRFFVDGGQTLGNYLELDDASIWGALPLLRKSTNGEIGELASRICDRHLYKCLDVGQRAELRGGDSRTRFKLKLKEARKRGEFEALDVLEDDGAKVSPYGVYEYESREAFKKVLIRKADQQHEDLAKVSAVVKALEDRPIFRVYGRNSEVMAKLKGISKEVGL